MKYQRGYTIVELLTVILILALAGGWVSNVVKVAGSSFDPLTAIVVLRFVGIFVAPLGAVLGFF